MCVHGQDECLLRVMEAKAKPPKGGRGKGRASQSTKMADSNEAAALPECFHSHDSDSEDFWGFPADFAEKTVGGAYSIQYTLDSKAQELFNSDEDSEDFKGFTRSELYVILATELNEVPLIWTHEPPYRGHSILYEATLLIWALQLVLTGSPCISELKPSYQLAYQLATPDARRTAISTRNHSYPMKMNISVRSCTIS